jgi:putative hemolysin
MITWSLIFIPILIGLNAFFVSVEFAAVASRRARLDIIPGTNPRALKIVQDWLENSGTRNRLIGASQLGITLVSLALGAVGDNVFQAILAPYFQRWSFPAGWSLINSILPLLPAVLSLIIISVLLVIFGEQAPKLATLHEPERFALFAAPVMQVFDHVFRGVISLLDWATRVCLHIIGITDEDSHSPFYSLEELKQIVSGPGAEAVIEQPQRDMLSAVIDFGELVVRQVGVPRTEIVGVEAATPLSDIIPLAIQQPFTKFPVYEDNLDQVIGIMHVRDLLAAMQDPEKHQLPARSLAREALFVPETSSVNDLLRQFRIRRQHMAIVLDEYGGTAGLVTLEDLLEEIVGEFRDPFNVDPPAIQTLPDGSILIDGLTPMEDINQAFGIHLADPNYDTIAGYVLGKLGQLPQAGDLVEDKENGVRLQVMNMDHLRIAQLSLSRL